MTHKEHLASLAPHALIHAEALPRIEAGLMALAGLRLDPLCATNFWPEGNDPMAAYRPYKVEDRVLQVPIRGALLNNFGWATAGATGYDYIAQAVARGDADEGVDAIALVIDSGGGMVAGNFDLVDRLYARRGTKPMRAFAAESAYSAAYNIASAADSITVTRSGGVGSIGVLTMHVDMSGALAQDGYKITLIHAGARKVDGNPFEALSPEARASTQARVDSLYSEFVSSVARNRGLDAKAVRATEAATFSATEALSMGLADSIGALDVSLAEFQAATLQARRTAMADKTAAEQAAITEAAKIAATEATSAERLRISTILASPEAKNRTAAALTIATGTDMPAATAIALLGTLPETVAAPVAAPAVQTATVADLGAAAPSMFAAAMANTSNPNVGSVAEASAEDPVEGVMAVVRGVGLPGFKLKSVN